MSGGINIIKKSSIEEIEGHLISLGRGNHLDNMQSISFLPNDTTPNYYLISLSEDEFFNLIFLQNDEVLIIAPRGQDRRLRAVATRALEALNSGDSRLSGNWDLASIYNRIMDLLRDGSTYELPPLLLRDARGTELEYKGTKWYIQDGSHRALAYAMAVLKREETYRSINAYCATANEF